MEFKKSRTAHVPKFGTTQNLRIVGKSAENSKVDKTSREPKIIASGSLTHEPLLTHGKDCDEIESGSREDKVTQLGLRARPKDRSLDEGFLFFKSVRDGLKRNVKKMPSELGHKKSKASASYEDVKKLLEEKEIVENSPPQTFMRPCGNTLDWDYYIKEAENLLNVPPVEYFRNAPFVNIWKDIAEVGLAIELRNPFATGTNDVFWIGTIVHFAGYRALVRFETFENSVPPRLAWISFCSDVPKHLLWCSENNQEMSPKSIVRDDMPTEELQKRLSEFYKRRTISRQHVEKLMKSIDAMKTLDHKVPLETLDIDTLDGSRLGRISTIMGNRVHVAYYAIKSRGENFDGDRGFWYNCKSESIHPFGWSHTVGVELRGVEDGVEGTNLAPSCFPHCPQDIEIKENLFLETRHPMRPHKIVSAKILQVFKHGYFLVQTREANKLTRVKFIYHLTSPFVLPVGFCDNHGIDLDYDPSDSRGNSLRLDLLSPKPSHKFQVGFKLEAIDILDSCYCAPATVIQVAGHLIKIYFDNWNKAVEKNYQWVDLETSDIYPCGYRELIGTEWHGCVEDNNSPDLQKLFSR